MKKVNNIQDVIQYLKKLSKDDIKEMSENSFKCQENEEAHESIIDEEGTWILCLEFEAVDGGDGNYFYDLIEAAFRKDGDLGWEYATKQELADIYKIIPDIECDYFPEDAIDYNREHEEYLFYLNDRL